MVDGSHAHDGILMSNAATTLTLGKMWKYMAVQKDAFLFLAGVV